MVYGGAPSEQLPALVKLISENLKAHRRCLYLNSPPMVAGIRSYLMAAGLDVQKLTQRGDLVLTSDQSHLVDGKFDSDRMLDLLKTEIFNAKRDGFSGLWASGDMSWELGSEINPIKLSDYEQRLEEMFVDNPNLFGVCQYHTATISPALLRVGLCQHKAIHGQALIKLNPLYLPKPSPDEFRTETSLDEIKEMLSRFGDSFVTIQ
jgi:hypothetical protein